MRDKIKAQYNSWYENHDVVFGREPKPVVKEFVTYLPDGPVLDIGGGEGRNALYVAAEGVPVVVTDLSAVGLNKVAEAAKEHELPVETCVSDVVEDGVSGEYAGVMMVMLLHHINTTDVETLIAEAKEHTVSGGLHVIETFSNEGELYARNQIKSRFYPSEEELLHFYDDWIVIRSEVSETTSFAKNKDGSPMRNMVVQLIAQKPSED